MSSAVGKDGDGSSLCVVRKLLFTPAHLFLVRHIGRTPGEVVSLPQPSTHVIFTRQTKTCPISITVAVAVFAFLGCVAAVCVIQGDRLCCTVDWEWAGGGGICQRDDGAKSVENQNHTQSYTLY